MNLNTIIRTRLNALLKKGEEVLATHEPNPPGIIGFSTLDSGPYAEWRNQALVCITDIFGSGHIYTENFESKTARSGYQTSVEAGLGILRAVLEDIENGYLSTLKELAAAEVSSDFLDQANYLLKNGYFIPAASLAGAVLENGLRSLAERKNITVKTKDSLSALNSRLADKNVYSRLRQKQIGVWIDVRNAADHGEFKKVTENDVAELVRGVQNFLAEEL